MDETILSMASSDSADEARPINRVGFCGSPSGTVQSLRHRTCYVGGREVYM